MPYYRRRRGGYRRRRRRRLPRRAKPMSTGQMAWTLAKRAWYASKGLRKLINVEFKKSDKIQALYPTPTAGLSQIVTISQGDGQGNRDGSSLLAKSLQYKLTLERDASASVTKCRVILFIWHDDETPTAADILESTTNVLSPYNIDQSRQYKILHSQLYTLSDQVPIIRDSIFRKLNHHMKFDGVNVGDFSSGSLWSLHSLTSS